MIKCRVTNSKSNIFRGADHSAQSSLQNGEYVQRWRGKREKREEEMETGEEWIDGGKRWLGRWKDRETEEIKMYFNKHALCFRSNTSSTKQKEELLKKGLIMQE